MLLHMQVYIILRFEWLFSVLFCFKAHGTYQLKAKWITLISIHRKWRRESSWGQRLWLLTACKPRVNGKIIYTCTLDKRNARLSLHQQVGIRLTPSFVKSFCDDSLIPLVCPLTTCHMSVTVIIFLSAVVSPWTMDSVSEDHQGGIRWGQCRIM